MEMHFHWHDVDHSNALKEHALKKIQKLKEHFKIDFTTVDLRFKHEKHNFFCEVSIRDDEGFFVASANHAEMAGAIDLCEHKLEKQMRRHKEKILSKRHD